MKKLLFVLLAVAFISSASSCKQCGYCEYANGVRGVEVCKANGVLGSTDALVANAGDYIIAESDCANQGGAWVAE